MFTCKRCGAALDVTASACPACGAEVELGRLTGILGVVCRACDAYNEPRAKVCASCGAPLGAAAPPAPASPPAPAHAAAPSAPGPAARPAPPGGPVVRAFAKGSGAGGPSARVVPLAPAAASAVSPGRARLVLERAEGGDGPTFRLAGETVAAGRAGGAVAFPDDPCLAPHHATFFYASGALHVRDEGAPGGTFLRLRGLSVPLRPGDVFAVGDRLLAYGGPLAAAPPPPPDGTHRLGAPRPPGAAIVVEERLEGGVAGRTFVRPGPAITIGRAGCAIDLGDDPLVSQVHAELVVDADGGAHLRDAGSASGVYVRIPPRAERELREGDRVRIGREVLRVSLAP